MFSGPHLYRSIIISSVWVCVFQDRTYIDRSSFCQFKFVFWGSYPYRSAIFLSVCVQLESRPHPYRSTIFLLVCVQFESGPHLYRSVIHHFVSFNLSQDRTYIDRSSFVFSLNQGCTYIDRPFSYQFVFSLSRGRTYIDQPSSYQFVFSLSRDRTHIDRSFTLSI